MTRLEAIDALLVKVKAGEAYHSGKSSWSLIKVALEPNLEAAIRLKEAWCNQSTDAAIVLIEAVLPGWEYGLNFDAHGEKYAFVGDGAYFETDEVYDKIHARALLIAFLEALKAKEKET